MTNSWVDLEDMRDFLRFQPDNRTDDDQLGELIDTACECIEDLKGRIGMDPLTGERTRVERLGIVILDESPVISIDAVRAYLGDGTLVDVPAEDPAAGVRGWTLDSPGGVLTVDVYHVPGVHVGTMLSVDYTVGCDPVPSRYVSAAKFLIQHLWQSSQIDTGGGRVGLGEEDTEFVRGMSGAAYALPFKVRELLGIFGSVAKSQVLAR